MIWYTLDGCLIFQFLMWLHCAADLLNIFEVFLPQLLLYPNPADPLNGDAASLLLKDQQQYEQKVKGKYFVSYFIILILTFIW